MSSLLAPNRPFFQSAVLPVLTALPKLDQAAAAKVRHRWNNKTKPAGSLGRLEEWVEWMAAVRGETELKDGGFHLSVFAGSHGVTAEGVSAFPSEVNALMLENFKRGGAAINAFCKAYNIGIQIVDTGIDRPTGNIVNEPAMDEAGLEAAFKLGWESVPHEALLFAVGEMGIGNTTPAAAIIAAILKEDVERLTGCGTGISAQARKHKAAVIAKALERHRDACSGNPWELLRRLGGREIAAMSGAILRATSLRIPVVLDGVIATSAAAIVFELAPELRNFCRAGHCSVEPAHIRILANYGLQPLLHFDMRLGEGTGAAMAMGCARGALSAYHNMASFADFGLPEVS